MDRLKSKVSRFPRSPGIYMMKSAGRKPLYIGKAKNLRARVRSYFSSPDAKTGLLMKRTKAIEYQPTKSEMAALLLEAKMVREAQPKYNIQLKDDKSFAYIGISKEEFPRVFVIRESDIPNSKRHSCVSRNLRRQSDMDSRFRGNDSGRKDLLHYYGPFLNAADLRRALKVIQNIFKFRTCKFAIRNSQSVNYKACLLYHIGRCAAPCINKISKIDYAKNIEALHRFLAKDSNKDFNRFITRRMNSASRRKDYERAAFYRDVLSAMDRLYRRHRDSFIREASMKPDNGLKELQRVFKMPRLPEWIMAVDISDIKGTADVGAIVTFYNGQPDKNLYRRYKIKGVAEGYADDYERMREVITRFLSAKTLRLPDIFVIDGGRGHLKAVRNVFTGKGVRPPVLVGIAKGYPDKIYTVSAKGKPERVKLDNNRSLKLLQRVRDEAHRFAQKYHHLLRRKTIIS
ncbi:MAG: GIY-YIG nuclease family protein [Planctomycetes bacterium]|nr:GIY-YIG nuclease family protein [Planctomycetota bacterium]